MHILVVNDDGPPSTHSSPYVHTLVRALQAAGHLVSVCLPHTQRSWIGKAHLIGQTVRPTYYRPPPLPANPAGLIFGEGVPESVGSTHRHPARRRKPAGGDGAEPEPGPEVEEWVLVDGTPASCVQIGLHHLFAERGPVDLVLSGPNYGRNTTALFALSSGTLGGALEGAACRAKSVAVSYAFSTRNHDPVIVAGASRHAVRVVEALVRQWPVDGSVDLYSINVPLVEGVEKGRTLWTGMLQNYWAGGGCFTAVEGIADEDEEEERIREGAGGEAQGGAPAEPAANEEGVEYIGRVHKNFKWHPRFTDVYKSVDDAPPGNDGWAVREGHTSVTALKANFWHAATHLHEKELQLPPLDQDSSIVTLSLRGGGLSSQGLESGDLAISTNNTKPGSDGKVSQDSAGKLYALVAYEDPYVQPLIMEALNTVLPKDSYVPINAPPCSSDEKDEAIKIESLLPSPGAKVLQITPYEAIDFTFGAAHVDSMLFNSYVFRKALIRKHFLSATVEAWVTKHPNSVLADHFKPGTAFEVDYAEFLDDALVEAWDLRASLERNEAAATTDGDKEWWILKPSMSDRGQGIRLFSTMEELQGIFDEWDADLPDSDDEGEGEDVEGEAEASSGAGAAATASGGGDGNGDYITTAHLRHFVAQPYIHPPLLLPQHDDRKFHVRTYVVCVGSLKVYVYRRMLALFAGKTYSPPSAGAADLDAHLTNTCLQQQQQRDDPDAAKGGLAAGAAATEPLVREFWDLPDALGGVREGEGEAAVTKDSIFAQICDVTGAAFEAAARGMMMHFQPLPNAFEVFGVDFLVDARGGAWLLEVNSFPDFRQTGDDLRGVVAGLWEGVVRLAVVTFFYSPSSSSPSAEPPSSLPATDASGGGDMVLVKDIDLGRRWGP
ncbi:TTL domain-containing protein [Gaeumannomyces tritici R3-111a-1]|uniref:TTL domain-containing protein n=1 Tax=Gaeumannomyces tritici (strain R3-111a-1) TaxID=644352 RepID=J3NH73_GAET3|nr:TTL domain-containing protein [Gaeumannomyces tritici R3-111a-1]EJT80616.1 TTL domain-containing protein [Gaeumannomyces tritici R3-111a-1]